jgi:hypothetical protein
MPSYFRPPMTFAAVTSVYEQCVRVTALSHRCQRSFQSLWVSCCAENINVSHRVSRRHMVTTPMDDAQAICYRWCCLRCARGRRTIVIAGLTRALTLFINMTSAELKELEEDIFLGLPDFTHLLSSQRRHTRAIRHLGVLQAPFSLDLPALVVRRRKLRA